MPSTLHGKVAVITGATQGIGLAIAQEFADHGANVVITGREQDQLDEAVAAIGPNCSSVTADVSDWTEMEALFAEVKTRHGRLDAVVANAAIGDHGPLGTITEAQFDRTFNTDVKGVLLSVQPALPLMTGGGSITVIGSTASVAPPAGMSLYAGAKAALRMLVRAWIQDITGSGIRINVLSPGAVDTPSLRGAFALAAGADQVDHLVDAIGQRSPIGRIGDPREIGKVAVFLASDDASYINGVELFADGGQTQV
jgi:NAD(P)-dependent dehydrogenase (short-subunit alcohol dehydrogenase family)